MYTVQTVDYLIKSKTMFELIRFLNSLISGSENCFGNSWEIFGN